MKIVFMGTPEFAVPCLQALIDRNDQILAVYTKKDTPKGRGMKLEMPPIKKLAVQNNIDVLQIDSFKSQEEVDRLQALAPDLIVVVAYGKILPKAVLQIPKFGCVNVHASLLPKYRGAGPIQWSVINGEKKTGITTMFMAEGLDTGDMILKSEVEIGVDQTAGELHDQLMLMGADTLIKTVELIEKNEAPREVQDDTLSCYAPMLDKKLCEIDFSKTTQQVHNQIRGLSPWPVATTSFNGKLLKVHRARIVDNDENNKNKMIYKCADGFIELLEVQLQGAKRMAAKDFLNGHR